MSERECVRDAIRARLPVDGSHMPSIVDLLEDEVKSLRALLVEVEAYLVKSVDFDEGRPGRQWPVNGGSGEAPPPRSGGRGGDVPLRRSPLRLSVPHVTCDAPGCGSVVTCCRKDGFPKAWFRVAPRPPGWKTIDAKHYCPRCKGQYA